MPSIALRWHGSNGRTSHLAASKRPISAAALHVLRLAVQVWSAVERAWLSAQVAECPQYWRPPSEELAKAFLLKRRKCLTAQLQYDNEERGELDLKNDTWRLSGETWHKEEAFLRRSDIEATAVAGNEAAGCTFKRSLGSAIAQLSQQMHYDAASRPETKVTLSRGCADIEQWYTVDGEALHDRRLVILPPMLLADTSSKAAMHDVTVDPKGVVHIRYRVDVANYNVGDRELRLSAS